MGRSKPTIEAIDYPSHRPQFFAPEKNSNSNSNKFPAVYVLKPEVSPAKMSSSVRRAKERGGGGGKIMASKPHKTLTENPPKETAGSCKKPSGKENSRTGSGARTPSVCQKAAVRHLPMQRNDKVAAAANIGKDGESRFRWSTSSSLKGKSLNPSDFGRFLSDLRNDHHPRISGSDRSAKTLRRASVAAVETSDEGKSESGGRVLEKREPKKPISSYDSRGRGDKLLNGSRVLESCKNSGLNMKGASDNAVRVSDDCGSKVYLVSDMEMISQGDRSGILGNWEETSSSHLNSNVKSEITLNVIPNADGSDDRTFSELKAIGISRSTAHADQNLKIVEMERIFEGDGNEVLRKWEERSSLHFNSAGKCEIRLNGVRVADGSVESACSELNSEGSVEKSFNGSRAARFSRGTTHADQNLKAADGKCLVGSGVDGKAKELKTMDESKGSRVINKYPSRLHEKLAYLEGKVKSIASDIKRTKEMLDQNNPDSSKQILLDIQDKISGIEKAMGHVIDDGKMKLGLSELVGSDNLHAKQVEKGKDIKVGSSKSSVNALTHEELEARLFPHHKLLRSRGSSSCSSGKDKNQLPNSSKYNGNPAEDKSLSPVDENPIALEFLASLTTDQSNIGNNRGVLQLERPAVQAADADATSGTRDASIKVDCGNCVEDVALGADETFDDFDDKENRETMILQEGGEDNYVDQLKEVGPKNSTGGWFVSEGESVLLTHDDGSCSFYDVTNSEVKSEYKPPSEVAHNLWGDCWLVRAPCSDGCSGRYVVAASAGNTLDSGFCTWDFYSKDVRAFRVEEVKTTLPSSRTVLDRLPNNEPHRRNALTTILAAENRQWWYKPCGPLLVSTATCQKTVSIYDIRDGDLVMRWDVPKPVLTMDYSSPLQWRNKGKVVIAETEAIGLWDVNSLTPHPLLSIATSYKKVTALHVNNTDAELGGGVRQRVSSSEAEGNDGVFSTHEMINVLDFRVQSGLGLKITKQGANSQSIFTRGDFIFLGSTSPISMAKDQPRSFVQQYSLRKGKLIGTYVLPDSNAHSHHSSITQVWGNSNLVMASSGLGLFVFDALKEDSLQLFSSNHRDAGEGLKFYLYQETGLLNGGLAICTVGAYVVVVTVIDAVGTSFPVFSYCPHPKVQMVYVDV
ncbi:hypothetical protein ACLOJK_011407 [Asimina triloba]